MVSLLILETPTARIRSHHSPCQFWASETNHPFSAALTTPQAYLDFKVLLPPVSLTRNLRSHRNRQKDKKNHWTRSNLIRFHHRCLWVYSSPNWSTKSFIIILVYLWFATPLIWANVIAVVNSYLRITTLVSRSTSLESEGVMINSADCSGCTLIGMQANSWWSTTKFSRLKPETLEVYLNSFKNRLRTKY